LPSVAGAKNAPRIRYRHKVHLIRHCKGVLELHPQWQAWAGQVRDILREAAAIANYCRVRSYLVSARGHGIRATDAIHAGKPWLPVPVTA